MVLTCKLTKPKKTSKSWLTVNQQCKHGTTQYIVFCSKYAEKTKNLARQEIQGITGFLVFSLFNYTTQHIVLLCFYVCTYNNTRPNTHACLFYISILKRHHFRPPVKYRQHLTKYAAIPFSSCRKPGWLWVDIVYIWRHSDLCLRVSPFSGQPGAGEE